MLDARDADMVVRRYRQRIAQFGLSTESLASGSIEKQKARHAVHASAIFGTCPSVLDIGCGLGSFYEYLRSQERATQYTGYDIVPEYITDCRAKYPEGRFELRNIFEEGIEQAYDTIVMSQVLNAWQTSGLPQPSYQIVDTPEEVPSAASKIGFPLIVKPTRNWGSRGVSYVKRGADLAEAIRFATQHKRNGRFIVEEFIEGTEMTLEGLVRRGELSVLARSDKAHQEHPRFKVAMELNYPAHFDAALIRRADEVVAGAVLALGLVDGAFHCECMVSAGDVHLIEMAGRPGGGHIFGQIVEAVSGVCMPHALASIFLGQPVDIAPRREQGVCYKFFAPPAGVFEAAMNVDEARGLPGILDLGLVIQPGTEVGPVASDADRPGYAVAEGQTRDEARARAEAAIAHIKYQMS